MRLILASASPRRLDLLDRIGVKPDAVDPPQIDESAAPGELPREHALRLAIEKAEAVAARHNQALVLDPLAPLGFALTSRRSLTVGD